MSRSSLDHEKIAEGGPPLTAAAAVTAVKAGDNGVDIAAQILAENEYAMEGSAWSDEEDKKLIRKVDWRLIPILFVVALLSGLDKLALSSGAIYGLKTDCNLTGDQYSWVGSITFFGGLAFMGPSAWALQHFSAVKFFSFNVFAWGVVEMCFAACNSYAGLLVCRFFLGGLEALLIPAITILVAMWYRPNEQPKRNSIILNVIAPIINGFIAWLVGYYSGPFAPWRIIFLVVGGFTVCWAVVMYLFLPENPLTAEWLSPREKYMIVKRKADENTGMESKEFKMAQVWEAMADVKTWIIWLVVIALQIPNGGLTTFNTIIINNLGFSSLESSLLSMPPGVMSTASGLILSWMAAYTRRFRTPLIAASIVLPLIGGVLCYTLPRTNLAGQLIGLYILYTYWAPYVTLVSVYQANTAGHTKKVVLFAWFYVAWAIGNIIGPQTFRESQAPAYTGGTIAFIVSYVFSIIMVLLYGAICYYENKARDKKEHEGATTKDLDWLDLTDKENVNFRYTT